MPYRTLGIVDLAMIGRAGQELFAVPSNEAVNEYQQPQPFLVAGAGCIFFLMRNPLCGGEFLYRKPLAEAEAGV